MPFVPFVLINNHRQTIQLGCEFMKDETVENFEWLFNCVLDAMGGFPLKTIITDQHQAMATTIAVVFLDIVHRNCRCHIMNKVQGPLGTFLKKKPELAAELNECMDYSVSDVEFETNWTTIIQKHEAGANSHLRCILQPKLPPLHIEHDTHRGVKCCS
jgi:zinc finger SWIM domain-containing protein 3